MIARASFTAAVAVAALATGASAASAATVSISNAGSVPEGSNGAGGTASFTVSVQRLSTETIVVTPTVHGGTATAGDDFAAAAPALTPVTSACAGGSCTDTLSLAVPVVGDNLDEADETFSVSLAAPGATVTSGGGDAKISDDDAPPTLEVGGEKLVEGNEGTKPAKVDFELREPSGLPVEVHYATSDGSASSGSDYSGRSGVVVIPPGKTEGHASIPVLGDTTVESDEEFRVNVTSVQNATLGDDDAKVTIVNDDVPPPPPPPPPAQGTTSPSHPGTDTPIQVIGKVPTIVATTTTHGAPGGSDLAGPAVRLGYAGMSPGGKVKLRVECPASEPDICSVRLRLHTRVRGHDVTLGSATLAHLRPGTMTVVKVALSRSARRALRRTGSFTVGLRARDAAGNVATAKATFDQ